jgi:SAM-dependent methyltransferase
MSKQNKPHISADEIRKAITQEANKARKASAGATQSVSREGLEEQRRRSKPSSSLKRAAKDSIKNMVKFSFRIPIIGHITKTCTGYMKMPSKFNYLLQQVEMLADRILVLERKARDSAQATPAVRQQPLPLEECGSIIEAAKVGTKDDPILDVGCGKGEWLAYLKERGYVAKGIEGNGACVQECSRRRLDVKEGIAGEYLKQQRDNAFGAVTYFHPVDGLPFSSLLELIDESRRIIKSGGLLISETPPGGDPDERNPLITLLRERGFNKAETVRIHPAPGSTVERNYLIIGYKA